MLPRLPASFAGSSLASVEQEKGRMPLFGHPGGMPEGSRGLRSALRDDTPGACAATPASRRDARFSAQNTGSGTPPGCDFLPCLNRGYRFARPPATFWHPSRMSLADFSASPLFHRKQRRTIQLCGQAGEHRATYQGVAG